MDSDRAVFLVRRLGPYHHARLQAWAASARHRVTVIEFRPADTVYAWAAVNAVSIYHRRQVKSEQSLWTTLEELQPAVVVCIGYADPEITLAVAWALKNQRALVTCSDSTRDDQPRTWIKETFKRQLIGAFDAALVAGTRSRAYLESLGLASARQFTPWDVVDNAHFSTGAERARREGAPLRSRLGLPENYFLCVARFVPEKNLPRLIAAYHRYVDEAGPAAWSLVLSGSGPLEPELRRLVAVSSLTRQVQFAGFLQYQDLPACYGLAGALVLASRSEPWGLVVNEAMAAGLPVLLSTRCGCAPDLLREGENGFGFDPEDEGQLTAHLLTLTRLEPSRLAAMGRCSSKIITAFSPAAFANGLTAALAHALAPPRGRKPWLTRRLSEILARRTVASS